MLTVGLTCQQFKGIYRYVDKNEMDEIYSLNLFLWYFRGASEKMYTAYSVKHSLELQKNQVA